VSERPSWPRSAPPRSRSAGPGRTRQLTEDSPGPSSVRMFSRPSDAEREILTCGQDDEQPVTFCPRRRRRARGDGAAGHRRPQVRRRLVVQSVEQRADSRTASRGPVTPRWACRRSISLRARSSRARAPLRRRRRAAHVPVTLDGGSVSRAGYTFQIPGVVAACVGTVPGSSRLVRIARSMVPARAATARPAP